MASFTAGTWRLGGSLGAGFHTSSRLAIADILDGKAIAKQVRANVKVDVDDWVKAGNRRPSLKAILVGDDGPSHTYVKNKTIAAIKTNIDGETIKLDSSIRQETLLQLIHEYNVSSEVDGILVQLPLPDHINPEVICNAIDPSKDVDGFHVVNLGRLLRKQRGLLPATPCGVMELIRRTGIGLSGRQAVVIGRSRNVGLPVALLMLDRGDATITVCHSRTTPTQLREATRQADIVVSAVGHPGTLTGDMVKPGAVVIDVGITRVDGRLVGDADWETVAPVAGWISPVPGGVGPMTVSMLMKNTLTSAKREINYSS